MCDDVYLIFSFYNGPWDPCECFKIKSIVSRNAVCHSLLAVRQGTTAESELQLLSVTEQTRYTLHWCQVAQVNDCIVKF